MRCFLAVLLSAIILPAAVFAGGSKAGGSAYPLGEYDIAYSGSTCGSPVAIAALKGFYAEEGVKINLVSGVSFEAQRTALAAGKMPITNGDFQFFPSVYNGIDVKLVGGLHEGCIKILVPVDSSINTLADLRGKTIAVDEIGGTPMSVASVAVGSAGINPQTEITWKPYPNDQLTQAVEGGEADLFAAWDPFATLAEQSGKFRVLLDISEHPLFAGKNCCFVFASGKLVKEKPKVVAAVLRAIHRAVEWIGANPEEAAKLLVESKSVATDNIALITELLRHYKYDHHYSAASNASAKDDAAYFAGELTKIGYLPADLDVKKFVDDLYVDIYALAK
ncbi:MAG: ABC transporter substrate-binding protein [Treponema sp.]|jgi:NitT/TauT family transport system substrate-binding protein|nr:ABC transporter substrate-binding protein [Treponema sp.]